MDRCPVVPNCLPVSNNTTGQQTPKITKSLVATSCGELVQGFGFPGRQKDFREWNGMERTNGSLFGWANQDQGWEAGLSDLLGPSSTFRPYLGTCDHFYNHYFYLRVHILGQGTGTRMIFKNTTHNSLPL